MPGSHESKLPELVLAPESGQFFYASQFRQEAIIDTSIIHDTLAVIANEVKQSSKTKMHFVKPPFRKMCHCHQI